MCCRSSGRIVQPSLAKWPVACPRRSIPVRQIIAARANIRAAIDSGAAALRPLLQQLADKVTPAVADPTTKPKPITLVLGIDQGEELFLAQGHHFKNKEALGIAAADYWSEMTGAFFEAAPYHKQSVCCGKAVGGTNHIDWEWRLLAQIKPQD